MRKPSKDRNLQVGLYIHTYSLVIGFISCLLCNMERIKSFLCVEATKSYILTIPLDCIGWDDMEQPTQWTQSVQIGCIARL